LLIYWLAETGVGWRLQNVIRSLVSRQLLATGFGLALPCVVSVVAGKWYGGAYGGLLSFDEFFDNMSLYWDTIVLTWLGLIFVPVPSLIGVWKLWRECQPLALGLTSFLVIWPAAHSPFLFGETRYMVPAIVVFMFFFAYGMSAALSKTVKVPFLGRVWCACCLTGLSFLFLLSSGQLVTNWHLQASRSNAGAAAEMRPLLQEMPPSAVLISAVTRAFQEDGFDIEYVDLFDETVRFRNRQEGIDDVDRRAHAALADGRRVYYLYSQMESDSRLFGGIWGSYRVYFDSLDRDLETVELFRVRQGRGGDEPWILYELVTPAGIDQALPPAGPVQEQAR
jgi:hypothetical protein